MLKNMISFANFSNTLQIGTGMALLANRYFLQRALSETASGLPIVGRLAITGLARGCSMCQP